VTEGERPPLDAACVDVQGVRVVLAPLDASRPEPAPPGTRAEFRVPGTRGILCLRGELEAGADGLRVLRVEAGGVERINRRAAYRLACSLKAEWAELPEPAPAAGRGSALEALAAGVSDRRPCVVLDVSVGGARISAAPPLPRPGSWILLWIRLAPREVLSGLAAQVLEARPDEGTAPFPGFARLRFSPLSARTEGRLGRFIVQAQVDLLRKGIRP